ncbi:hypothetical protein AK51_19800 [Serratia nematodiphila DZ0503SBS1]|nr:hypothetical protein AK51_19800 [Serratia nematodiphila DZ0503SBS1]
MPTAADSVLNRITLFGLAHGDGPAARQPKVLTAMPASTSNAPPNCAGDNASSSSSQAANSPTSGTSSVSGATRQVS